jgi:hypothetical protein
LVSRRISWPCREFRKPPPNEKRFDAAWLPPVLETDGGDSGNVRPGDASDFVILQNHFAILQATIAGLHCTPVRWQKIHVKLHSNNARSPDIFVTWKILPVRLQNQPARWQNFPAILQDKSVKSQISLVTFRNCHENTQNGLGTWLARPMLNIFQQHLNAREP